MSLQVGQGDSECMYQIFDNREHICSNTVITVYNGIVI